MCQLSSCHISCSLLAATSRLVLAVRWPSRNWHQGQISRVAERFQPKIRIARSCSGLSSIGLCGVDLVLLQGSWKERWRSRRADWLATSLNSSSLVYSEDMKDRARWRFPSFLQCISWNQRSWRKDNEAKAENNIHEGTPSSLPCTLLWLSEIPHDFLMVLVPKPLSGSLFQLFPALQLTLLPWLWFRPNLKRTSTCVCFIAISLFSDLLLV